MHEDGHSPSSIRDPRKELAALQERQERFEEIQAQSEMQLERIQNDPRVKQVLADYARDYGEGDPCWWKPEFELGEAMPSERVEHVVTSAPQSFVALSETIAKVVIAQTEKQLERLSEETGITMADLRTLDSSADTAAHTKEATLRRSHVALRVANQVRGVSRAVEQYGLDREEFEELPTGPEDRTAGTMVGRQHRPAARKLETAKKGLTGTAKLEVPNEVREQEAASSERPAVVPLKRSRGFWLAGVASMVGVVLIVTLRQCKPDEDERGTSKMARSPVTAMTAATANRYGEQRPSPPLLSTPLPTARLSSRRLIPSASPKLAPPQLPATTSSFVQSPAPAPGTSPSGLVYPLN